MRHYFSAVAIFFLTFSFSFFACEKSNSNPGLAQQPAAGSWIVSYFFDKTDETHYFDGFVFEFKDAGVLIASQGSQTWTGTWSDNCDDSAVKFCINFSGNIPSSLEEISEDWRVIEISDKFMHFEHTSGGNGDTDILHFKK